MLSSFFFSFPRLISRKHAIKPKFFDYRGSLKIFRSANNLYTIQSPNFAFIENLYSCLTQAQNLVKYWGCCAYRRVVRKQVGFQDLKNFFIKKFITAIENTRSEIYLRFIWIQTYRKFYFSWRLFAQHYTISSWNPIFNSRFRSHNIRVLSISKFFAYCCHSDIDFTKNCILTNFNS